MAVKRWLCCCVVTNSADCHDCCYMTITFMWIMHCCIFSLVIVTWRWTGNKLHVLLDSVSQFTCLPQLGSMRIWMSTECTFVLLVTIVNQATGSASQHYSVPVPSQDKLEDREFGAKMGDDGGGAPMVQMGSRSFGLLVCLPLLSFPAP